MVSASLSLFSNLYLEDYTDRKDPLYCSSARSNFALRGFLVTVILSNSVLLRVGSELILYLSLAVFSLVLLAWYLISGYSLYAHRFPRLTLSLTISLFLTMVLSFFLRLSSSFQVLSFENILQLLTSFAVIEFSLIVYSKRIPTIPHRI